MKQESMVEVGVKSFILNKEGKILLMRRNSILYPSAPNMWDIPGGRIREGETLDNNLKREVYEETGLKPKIIQVLGAQDIIKPNVRVVRITYVSCVTSSKVKLSEEHTEFKWVTQAEALKTKGLDPFAKKLLKDIDR